MCLKIQIFSFKTRSNVYFMIRSAETQLKQRDNITKSLDTFI